jgi:type VI secretion system secreted protein VgrG
VKDGLQYADRQLEALEARHQVVHGESNVRAMRSGGRFELKDHYRADMNIEYAILEVTHEATAGDYRSAQGSPASYSNQFQAIPHSVPYRPLRLTPTPVVYGSQTAVVVGPSGEEIYVDKHGRVKVQFHWDREGKKDDKSSCWIRVSTAWAGKGWGAIHLPRIGQEVIVDFLEGDPDEPIITGRVYNDEQTVPYDLPAN